MESYLEILGAISCAIGAQFREFLLTVEKQTGSYWVWKRLRGNRTGGEKKRQEN